MGSNILNYFSVSILLLLTDFQEISLLLEIEDCLFRVNGAPVSNKPEIDSTSYLQRYGYLPRSDFETHQPRSDSEKQEAIRRFQRMIRINQTGNMDSETKKAMQRPRCGQPDIVPKEFKIGPSRWGKMALTYRILSYTGDLRQNSVEQAIQNGFGLWSSVTPLIFQQIFVGEADLMIDFRTYSHGDGNDFDGNGGILAHAFSPGEGRGGDIHFDDDEHWTTYSQEGINLHIVASHEIGHALGLGHSQDQDSLMYPVYQGYVHGFRLSKDDIEGIQTIYGSKSRPRLTPYTSRYPVYEASTSPRPPVGDDPPDLCRANLEEVSSIRGDIFAFHGKWFWWLRRNDVSPAVATEITSYWEGLPNSLDHIDAVFESKNGRIFFFIGRYYWEFTVNQLAAAGFTSSRRSIYELGLPPSVERITAAFVWKETEKIYLFSQDNYWELQVDDRSQIRVVTERPRGMETWMGSPFPIDAAFTHFDNRNYFMKGSQVWRLAKNATNVESANPQRTRTLWPQCNGAEVSSMLQSSALTLHAILALLSHLLLSFEI